MGGYDGYRLGSGQAGKYRIGLNIVRTGEIGVKGLFLKYGEYSAEYSSYSRNKPFTPILPVRTIFSPILYLPARPDLTVLPYENLRKKSEDKTEYFLKTEDASEF